MKHRKKTNPAVTVGEIHESRLVRLFKNNKKALGIVAVAVLVALVVGAGGYFLFHKQDPKKLHSQAVAAAKKKDYSQSIADRKVIYNQTSDPKLKAQTAFDISVDYYSANDSKNGKIWGQRAVDQFTKLGNKTKVQSIQAYLNAKQPAPANSQTQTGTGEKP